MVYIDYPGYNYREVEGSATRNVVQHNYFQNILKMYHFDYKSNMNIKFSEEEIQQIKAIKFLKNVVSLVHIYFNPSNKLNFKERYSFVKEMINNEEVQNVMRHHFELLFKNSNRYDKFLLKSIKQKSTFKLHLATMYSRYKNR